MTCQHAALLRLRGCFCRFGCGRAALPFLASSLHSACCCARHRHPPDPPGLLFFTTYTLLVLFWAEIYHQARSMPTGSLRPIFVTFNALVYAVQVRLARPLLRPLRASVYSSINSQQLAELPLPVNLLPTSAPHPPTPHPATLSTPTPPDGPLGVREHGDRRGAGARLPRPLRRLPGGGLPGGGGRLFAVRRAPVPDAAAVPDRVEGPQEEAAGGGDGDGDLRGVLHDQVRFGGGRAAAAVGLPWVWCCSGPQMCAGL